MTSWHTFSARFTTEEKAILDEFEKKWGFTYNQSLRKGIELLGRFLALGEFYVKTENNKALKMVAKEFSQGMREINARIEKLVKKYPEEFSDANYENIVNAMNQMLTPWDVFSQERKRGRKQVKASRGKPRTRL